MLLSSMLPDHVLLPTAQELMCSAVQLQELQAVHCLKPFDGRQARPADRPRASSQRAHVISNAFRIVPGYFARGGLFRATSAVSACHGRRRHPLGLSGAVLRTSAGDQLPSTLMMVQTCMDLCPWVCHIASLCRCMLVIVVQQQSVWIPCETVLIMLRPPPQCRTPKEAAHLDSVGAGSSGQGTENACAKVDDDSAAAVVLATIQGPRFGDCCCCSVEGIACTMSLQSSAALLMVCDHLPCTVCRLPDGFLHPAWVLPTACVGPGCQACCTP